MLSVNEFTNSSSFWGCVMKPGYGVSSGKGYPSSCGISEKQGWLVLSTSFSRDTLELTLGDIREIHTILFYRWNFSVTTKNTTGAKTCTTKSVCTNVINRKGVPICAFPRGPLRASFCNQERVWSWRKLNLSFYSSVLLLMLVGLL